MPPAQSNIATRKYDWDLAFALFCGGFTREMIMNHELFRGMSPNTLNSTIKRQGWIARRDRLARLPNSNALDNAAKTLQERLQTEGIEHQSFILSELGRERSIFKNRHKDEESQMERLQILEKIDNLGRKISKLDDQKEANPNTQNFQFLVHLQASTPREASEASVGILRSNNAYVEAVETLENSTSRAELEAGATESHLKPMPPASSLFGAAPISQKPS